jgi:oxygen-independent coproporphyrinogen III oxidase
MPIFVIMAGIYIHIPFCKQKCSYCDFHFSTTFDSYRDSMLAAMVAEIEIRKPYLSDQKVNTIYFGGGTPSLLNSTEIDAFLEQVRNHFSTGKNLEITLESNPDDISIKSLEQWKRAGINRLSIGLQSFREKDLQWMNRAHTSGEALQCVEMAKQVGFDNISVDLIYGLPDLSIEEWRQNLQKVIDFRIQHVSAYCLTVEDKTVLKKWVQQKKMKIADENLQSAHFELLVKMLKESGLEQYEISNFSLKGFQSKHNSNYWKRKHYLGIGPSAHSFNGISRSWNISNNAKYLQAVERGECWQETEQLSPTDRFNELVLIGLRTSQGVDLEQLKAIAQPNGRFYRMLTEFEEAGWLTNSLKTIKLTKEGKLRADYIASDLFLN